MNNAIIDDLKSRYTCKKYDENKKVSPADFAIFLEALRLSASSINSQPWKFIVLESATAKKRMERTFIDKYQFNQPHILESSYIILFAHNPYYSREDYLKVINYDIADGRTKEEDKEAPLAKYIFAELQTDENGYNGGWTKAQVYLALGNALHTLARLKIDSTTMEGIDTERVNKEFAKELDDYQCDVALAIGYHHKDDYNNTLPKSRLRAEDIIVRI